MNSQQEVLPDGTAACPETVARNLKGEQPTVIVQDALPVEISEPAATKRPTLLENLYYWIMSRL